MSGRDRTSPAGADGRPGVWRCCLAVASKGKALRHASQRLRADRDVVELALRNDGMALQFAPAGCSDKYLVTLALHNNGEALRFVDLSLWDDPDIIAAAQDSIGPVAVEGHPAGYFGVAPGI